MVFIAIAGVKIDAESIECLNHAANSVTLVGGLAVFVPLMEYLVAYACIHRALIIMCSNPSTSSADTLLTS